MVDSLEEVEQEPVSIVRSIVKLDTMQEIKLDTMQENLLITIGEDISCLSMWTLGEKEKLKSLSFYRT